MKPTSCLLILSLLVVAGQLVGQQLASGLVADDSLSHQFAGLLSWSIPATGFLGLILFSVLRSRQKAPEPVAVDEG